MECSDAIRGAAVAAGAVAALECMTTIGKVSVKPKSNPFLPLTLILS